MISSNPVSGLGNPLGCAAALATLDVLSADETAEALRATAQALTAALHEVAFGPRAGVRAVFWTASDKLCRPPGTVCASTGTTVRRSA